MTSHQFITRFGKIADTLGNGGYSVVVLNWDKTGKRASVEDKKSYVIKNYNMKPSKSFGSFSLPVYYIFWWMYVIYYLIKNKPDVIQPENFYHYVPAIMANIILRKKIVYDIADFFASSFQFTPRLQMFLGDLENLTLKFADIVIIADEYRISEINRKNVKNLLIIMNTPRDVYSVIETQETDPKKKFTIYYGGDINQTRGIDEIILAIKDIKDVKLVIAGTGSDLEKYLSKFHSYSNIEYLGVIDLSESLSWTKKADIIVAFYDPKIAINRLASPNKLFDAMMCGTAIIGNIEAKPLADRIKENNCGYLSSYYDVGNLKKILESCQSNYTEMKQLGTNGRKAYLERYNWDLMEKRLLNGYYALLQNKG